MTQDKLKMLHPDDVNLKLGEGTFFGQPYYTVDPNPNWDPYWYNQGWHDMENWCCKTFGIPPMEGTWWPDMRWCMDQGKFWFKEQRDLEWFLLRWA